MATTPLGSESHVSQPITTMCQNYMQSQADYVALKTTPKILVKKQTGKYFVFDKATLMANNFQRRGPGERLNRSGFRLSSVDFNCEVYGDATDLSNQQRANWDEAALGNVDRSKARYLGNGFLQHFERAWASAFFANGLWGTSTTPGTLWSAQGSTPIEDVLAGKRTVKKNTGYEPNTMTVGYEVHEKLLRHPDIIDLIKHTSGPGNPAVANEETLAKVFGVAKYTVCKATKNTAGENETFSGDFVQGKHALLAYMADAPSKEEPSAAYIFAWDGVGEGVLEEDVAITKYWDQDTRSDVWEIEVGYDLVICGADLGYFFNGAVA